MIRIHYIFYGRVQGVGFRYRAAHAARLYGLTGWVENNFDGSVAMELQGELASIEKVLESLRLSPFIQIVQTERQELQPVPESGFTIRG